MTGWPNGGHGVRVVVGDGHWADLAGPTQQLLIAVAFNDPRLLHLSWMRPSAAPRMTLPSQVGWQSRRKCVRNVALRHI